MDEPAQSESTFKNSSQPEADEKSENQSVEIGQEEKILLTWVGPARPFKKRDKKFYITVVAIAGLFSLIMFLAEGPLPVLLIVSVVFLFYVLSTVEPEQIEYQITTKGIKMAGRQTPWGDATRFWFTTRLGIDLLVLETVKFPGRLEVVVPEEKKRNIKDAVTKYLKHEQAPPSSLDKLANWFSKKLPGLG